MQVSALHVYPVKSLRGVALESADVEHQGLQHDRRWMVVDHGGAVLTARSVPRMLSITARPGPAGDLELSSPGRPPLAVPVPHDGAPVPVALSRVQAVRDAGPVAAQWLSDVLSTAARLVWQDDPRRRSVSPRHGGRPGDVLSLADTGPLLLTSTASLRRLDRWVADAYAARFSACGAEAGSRPAALAMERFRPNVVVDGVLEPFAEDAWGAVTLGAVGLRTSELADRCVMTTLDPETQVRGPEPLRTLSRHRRWDGQVWFGIRLVPITLGTIRLGDPVAVPGDGNPAGRPPSGTAR